MFVQLCYIVSSTVTLFSSLTVPVMFNAENTIFSLSGDIIFLGQSNMFRFNNPMEAAKLRETRKVRLLIHL